MSDFVETLQNGGWVRYLIVIILASICLWFTHRKTDKMERDLFGDDADRYRADANGVSPFDRPPVGYEEAMKVAQESKSGSEEQTKE